MNSSAGVQKEHFFALQPRNVQSVFTDRYMHEIYPCQSSSCVAVHFWSCLWKALPKAQSAPNLPSGQLLWRQGRTVSFLQPGDKAECHEHSKGRLILEIHISASKAGAVQDFICWYRVSWSRQFPSHCLSQWVFTDLELSVLLSLRASMRRTRKT